MLSINQLFVVFKEYFDEKTGIKEKKVMNPANRDVCYAGKQILDGNEAQNAIRSLIESGKPCCIARLGGNELFSMSCFEFGINVKKEKAIDQLCTCAGFFPNDISFGHRYNECMKEACGHVDLLGVFASRFEEYYIREYAPHAVQMTRLFDLEPWKYPENPWSDVLKGKKVLVIHPLAETIQKQYQKQERLFENTAVLPAFELKTLKAVQTIAGEKDDRFSNWFEALEWMYQEALKIDFDIAIIGCGAYGFPLAAKLKEAGKQAFHLGGATQLMFGIKGKRWVEDEKYAYVQQFMNDAWVYPSSEDIPHNADKVEDSCYWK